MANQPLVSIAVPVYNGEKYLKEAVQSILKQDYVNLDIILYDNASSDSTPKICQEFANNDDRIRIFKQEKNIGAARNFVVALTKAKGKYFTWLAHDDLLHNEYVSSTVKVLEANSDIVLCGCGIRTFFDEDQSAYSESTFDVISKNADWKKARVELFRWPKQQIPLSVNIYGLYRTDILRKIKYLDKFYPGKPNFIMEHAIIASMTREGRIVALPEILRMYRCNLDSTAYLEDEKYNFGERYLKHLITKLALLEIAVNFPAPFNEKIPLLIATLRNFIYFKKAPTIRQELKMLRKEIKVLRTACRERLELINKMSHELRLKEETIASLMNRTK